jgi:putative transposase
VDYVHWNPVKHGLVDKIADWRYSSFHRYVGDGIYPEDWTFAMNEDELKIAEKDWERRN